MPVCMCVRERERVCTSVSVWEEIWLSVRGFAGGGRQGSWCWIYWRQHLEELLRSLIRRAPFCLNLVFVFLFVRQMTQDAFQLTFKWGEIERQLSHYRKHNKCPSTFTGTAMGGETHSQVTWNPTEQGLLNTREPKMCECRRRTGRCLKVSRTATPGTRETPRLLFLCDAIPKRSAAKGAAEHIPPVRWSTVIIHSLPLKWIPKRGECECGGCRIAMSGVMRHWTLLCTSNSSDLYYWTGPNLFFTLVKHYNHPESLLAWSAQVLRRKLAHPEKVDVFLQFDLKKWI